jgi:RimJ/RimL family protein N-acetyltransferase
MYPPFYKTENYELVPYQQKDLERYLEIALDSDVVEYMGGATGDIEKEMKMFKKIFEIYRNQDQKRWFWIWAVYRDQTLCAHVEVKQTQDTAEDELEVVYMVHPAERRIGLMTEVLKFIKAKQSDWKRTIIATIYPENEHSYKLLEQIGIERQELITDAETGETFKKVWMKT